MRITRNARVETRALVAIVPIAAVAAAITIWGWSQAPAPVQPTASNQPADAGSIKQVEAVAAQARQLQREGKTREADDKWAEVEKQNKALSAPEELAPLRQEAVLNRKELKPFLDKGAKLTDELTRPESAIARGERPEEIGHKEVLRFYPIGRTISSGGEFVIEGRGTGRDWVFKNEAYFVVVVLAGAETEVRENDGHTVRFEIAFKEISRNFLASDGSLELTEPDSPILVEFWRPFEETVLNGIPAYRILKQVGELANLADPRLRRTLTWLQKRLRRNGVQLTSNDPIEMISGIDRLSGTRVELTYIDGVGVAAVKVLDGIKLPEEDLEGLCKSSGPLLDYFIFPGAQKKVGERWKVRAQDVANLIHLSYRYDVSGEFTLERGKDELGPPNHAVLNIVNGDVSCVGRGDESEERVDLAVESGFVKYSEQQLLATGAKTRFQLKSSYHSLDHFLFGASDVRDLNIEARYHAQIGKGSRGE
jgi:hypothetical protein